MTTAQRDAISNAATGVLIYNSTTDRINYYTSGEWRDANFSYNTNTTIIHHGLNYGIVQSATGRYWLDRNLGASRVAQSIADADAYGDLYQWGRTTDGHEKRTSTAAAGPVTAGSEGSNFLTNGSSPYDWLSTQDDTRWNGAIKGAHDPCPDGFRVSTETELNAERMLFSTNDLAGAFASILKLPSSGFRRNTGSIADAGAAGNYWTSMGNGTNARRLSFGSTDALMTSAARSYGYSVRCIKE